MKAQQGGRFGYGQLSPGEAGSGGVLGPGSGSILISDVLKCSRWRPPQAAKAGSSAWEVRVCLSVSWELYSAKEMEIFYMYYNIGVNVLRRHFGHWAEIKLYQVWDMLVVSGQVAINKKKASQSPRWGRVSQSL